MHEQQIMSKHRTNGWTYQILAALYEIERDRTTLPEMNYLKVEVVDYLKRRGLDPRPETVAYHLNVLAHALKVGDTNQGFLVQEPFGFALSPEGWNLGEMLQDRAFEEDFRSNYAHHVSVAYLEMQNAQAEEDDRWICAIEIAQATGISEDQVRRGLKEPQPYLQRQVGTNLRGNTAEVYRCVVPAAYPPVDTTKVKEATPNPAPTSEADHIKDLICYGLGVTQEQLDTYATSATAEKDTHAVYLPINAYKHATAQACLMDCDVTEYLTAIITNRSKKIQEALHRNATGEGDI